VRWDWDTSLSAVMSELGPTVPANTHFHVGEIPGSMRGLESAQIAFVYLDLTLYAGTKGALEFIVPRLVSKGQIFIRDYYGSTKKWPGLVRAVDECGLHLRREDYDAVYQSA
jgi:hypothetical protein